MVLVSNKYIYILWPLTITYSSVNSNSARKFKDVEGIWDAIAAG